MWTFRTIANTGLKRNFVVGMHPAPQFISTRLSWLCYWLEICKIRTTTCWYGSIPIRMHRKSTLTPTLSCVLFFPFSAVGVWMERGRKEKGDKRGKGRKINRVSKQKGKKNNWHPSMHGMPMHPKHQHGTVPVL